VTHIPRGMIESMTPLVNGRRHERRVEASTASAVVESSHLSETAIGA
jgi:hypothetical protein